MTDTDRSKYERDLFFIKMRGDKMKGRDKKIGKQELMKEQKKKEVAKLKSIEQEIRKR